MSGDQLEGVLTGGFLFLFVLGLVAIIRFSAIHKINAEARRLDAEARLREKEKVLDAQRFANANAMTQKIQGAA